MKETVEILGVNFSCNTRLEHEEWKCSRAMAYEELEDWRESLSY